MRKDWIKIKNYYLTHEISLEALAKKYKCSLTQVKAHCSKESWVSLKKEKQAEIDRKTNQKITEQEVDRKVKANELHNELFNKCLIVASKLLNKYMEELESGKKKTSANAYNLDFVTKAIANAQKGQRLSLRIDDTEDLNDKKEPEVFVIKGLDLDKI